MHKNVEWNHINDLKFLLGYFLDHYFQQKEAIPEKIKHEFFLKKKVRIKVVVGAEKANWMFPRKKPCNILQCLGTSVFELTFCVNSNCQK